jgi:hypothetical protein
MANPFFVLGQTFWDITFSWSPEERIVKVHTAPWKQAVMISQPVVNNLSSNLAATYPFTTWQ